MEVAYSEIQRRHKKRVRIVPMDVIDDMIRKMDMVEKWEVDEVKYVIREK